MRIPATWQDRLRAFPTLRGYRRRWLGRDALAGLTFGAVTIPGQMATAHLAGMPPITGLYGYLAACLMAALIAANRHLALGVDSTVAPMLAAGMVGLGLTEESTQYVAFAVLTTFLVGVMILVVGIGNMGWFGDFLSKPVVIGFLGGIAVIIVVDQIPGLLGLPEERGDTVERVSSIVGLITEYNTATVAVGCLSLAGLLLASRLSRRIPGALMVLALAITAVTVLDLTAEGVAVVGQLQPGLPGLSLPQWSWDDGLAVAGTAVAIALICLAQTAATSRSAAAVAGFETDINADYRALGAGNVLSSLFGSFTVDASPPSTTIIGESRGRSQAVGLVAAILVVIVLFASELLENLPTATLSAVLIFIAAKIFRVSDMRSTWRYSWRAFTLMLMTLMGVLFLGIVYGVALAVLVSFMDRARRTARPELLRLGRMPDGHWLPAIDARTMSPPAVAAFLLNGPLWFGNANWFRLEMLKVVAEGPDKPALLVLDATRMDDIDYTGADALLELNRICRLRGVRFAVASHVGRAREEFDEGGLIADLGPDAFYDNVDEAVRALAPKANPA